MNQPTRRRRPDDRPDAILDAALAIFADVGFDRASVDDIARRARVSADTVHLYFASKEAMIEALVEQSSARIADAVASLTAGQAAAAPEAALRGVFRLLFKTISDPDISAATRIIISEGARFPALAAHYRMRVIDTGHLALETLVAQGVEAGRFRRIDPDAVNRALIGPAVAQLLMATIFEDPADAPPDPDLLAEACLDLIMNGLKVSET